MIQQTVTFDPDEMPGPWTDAVDLASDQDSMTWIADPDGKRVAAIVPVADAEHLEEQSRNALSPFYRPGQVPRGGSQHDYPCHHAADLCHPVSECAQRHCPGTSRPRAVAGPPIDLGDDPDGDNTP